MTMDHNQEFAENNNLDLDIAEFRMGTKVEGKTYLPGYFAMADSSVNSNGNWLLYHGENKPNGHLRDRFTIIPANGSANFDKEMLKRTMLVHEATFRKQVYELHRLYKIQKDLMAQCRREEFNGYPRSADTLQARSYSSQAPSGDVKRVWQVGPTSGHDIKQSSVNFTKGSGSEYSLNGAPLRHSNGRSTKKMLDLQLPADAYADDDDDVEILEEKPAKILPRTNGSVLGGNVKLNIGNSEGSLHMDKSWITGLQPQHGSAVNVLNKTVEESSSSMKITDFLGVGTSTSQNQHYSSGGVNLNLLRLQDNLKEKRAGETSGSYFFGANEEIRHKNSFSHKKDDQNVGMAWFKHKQNGVDSSTGHYLSSSSTFNPQILAPPSSNAALTSLWQSSNTNYTTRSHYGAVETPFAQNGLFNGFSVDSFHAPNAPHHYHHLHSSKIPGEPQHQKHSPLHDCLKDVNLNDPPRDVSATQEQGSENSPVDISWLRKKPVDLMKPQVPLNGVNEHSQLLFGSAAYSEGSTRILGFPFSAATEKDFRCSSSLHMGTNITPSPTHEALMEMQFQKKEVDSNVRNLIDLNDALPFMDDPEIDVRQSDSNVVPQEPDDPSKDSLAITAAESLVAMCDDVFQTRSPQLDTLHWFADLVTSKENAVVYSTDSESEDDFEALTLQLQETKGYEYHLTPRTQELKSNEDHGSAAATLLLTKPRRGQARRRRQKKDFQKDILPGLASLSKHEVSEDLHTLGRSFPAAPTKRGGRNGSQPRGRRQARCVAVTVEEAEVSPPPMPPPAPLAPADLDAGALGITGWGRTTRRCRRPRCPPANNASLRLA